MSKIIGDGGEFEQLREGKCKKCGAAVILVKTPDPKKPTALFHRVPVCQAFDGDLDGDYAQNGISWPAAN